ncbi:RluA family pseudouridine synthase [Amphibacillus xylanus]|uniref:Pseudouridine synthase n=1 Tax=Amphibacillus xylanus (strain ATCC 51415 / DSM 6626 / JCM 7361 / LMG 17667 / NBRC 15112 / Ep01) TaxID=698758 RepID=K0J3Z3_AMPXN|nr:RluA family pseudouridine synthase [Amphibacillus xylanus]BAM47912.1 putative pseudouridine synthase [Amphibacillus xylanus NBRC 15112]
MLIWQVTEAENQMILRDFLREKIGLSRAMVKTLKFDGGQILVNDELVTVRKVLTAGDQVRLVFPKEIRSPSLTPVKLKLDIIYEDDFIIILNKDANIAVIPSLGNQEPAIANGLIYHYDQQNVDYTVHIVTRLDRDTSGLMLVAKQDYCHSLLHQKPIERHYMALVHGKLMNHSGTINAPIGRKSESIIERMVTPEGKQAITHYQLIRAYDDYSLVAVQLETGRTHQIRVHFAHIGHPLAGDQLYGGSVDLVKRQALHCTKLSFNHPITNERLQFESNWPEDLNVIEK